MTIGKLSGQCDFGQKGQSYCNQRGQSCVAKRVKVAWLFHLPSMAKVSQNKREVSPEFPGGITALVQFLSKNLKFPTVCKEQKIQGKVLVKFTVKSDGSISNIRVTKSVDPYLDKEAVRVVKSMPRWIPGTQDGKPVNVEYTLPITFKL